MWFGLLYISALERGEDDDEVIVLAYEPEGVLRVGGHPGGLSPYAQVLRQAAVETDGTYPRCPHCAVGLDVPPIDEALEDTCVSS